MVYLNGTGISGSQSLTRAGFQAFAVAETQGTYPIQNSTSQVQINLNSSLVVNADIDAGPEPTYNTQLDPNVSPYFRYRNVQAGDTIKFIANLVSWAEVIRRSFAEDAVDEVISTRRLLHIANAYAIFNNKEKALNLCINRFDMETKNAFLELYSKVDETFKFDGESTLSAPESDEVD